MDETGMEKSDKADSQQEVEDIEGGKDKSVTLFNDALCGDEFYCRKGHSRTSIRCTFRSQYLRPIMAFVWALLFTWILLSIIVSTLRVSLMYPAEAADSCTVCSGDIGTITFQEADTAAPDRLWSCCEYDPVDYLTVENQGFVNTPEGDEINWWYMPGNASYGTQRLSVMYNHGSGRLLASAYRLQRYHFLTSIGVNVITYDYAGYGKSTTSSSELSDDTATRSAEAMLSLIRDGTTFPDVNTSKIIALGRSMGTGVVLELVSRGENFLAVMLQSPFLSYSETVGIYIASGLSSWLVKALAGGNVFDNVDNMQYLQDPLYESMSESDDFIPFDSAQMVFDASVNVPESEKDFYEYTCRDHDDDLSDGQKAAMLDWFDQFR
jgi:pimeloyl-ACP methyl ester carboxylesterase